MRSILEKALAHVVHGDTDKAEALFHKFMVEKARQIHESLRQDEGDDLGNGWDDEIKEEEYFGGNDLSSAEDDETPDGEDDDSDIAMDTTGEGGDDAGEVEGDTDVVDDEGDDDGVDFETDDSEEGAEGIDGKLDNLEDKIDELTAEFDRLMSELDGDHGEGFGDEEGFGDDGETSFDDDDVSDAEGEEPHMDTDDTHDLAGRMDTDMADDDEQQPEDETMEDIDMGDDDDALDEELADITESVLSELEKVAMPGNSDGKEIGTGKQITGNRNNGSLPHHNVNDRIAGAKPYMVKGGNNDSFERETAPSVRPVSNLVKGPKNSRKKWEDGTSKVSREGDKSAKLNSNFAGGEKTGKSPVDGEMKPKTR